MFYFKFITILALNMDEFENISLDDITIDEAGYSYLEPSPNGSYSDLPELEPLNLDTITELAVTPDDLQLARDNLSGLLNRLDHTIPSTDSMHIPAAYNIPEVTCNMRPAYNRAEGRIRKHTRPEIINYGTIIYSSQPATQNSHVAKWLNRFTQVLETIYEHEPDQFSGAQSHDDMLSGVLEELYDYSTKLPTCR